MKDQSWSAFPEGRQRLVLLAELADNLSVLGTANHAKSDAGALDVDVMQVPEGRASRSHARPVNQKTPLPLDESVLRNTCHGGKLFLSAAVLGSGGRG